MNFTGNQIDELKSVFGDVETHDEGGYTYFLLPNLVLPEGCKPAKLDALLCPKGRDGYTSRLFFAQRIECANNLNWNGNCRIIERNWYAFSWTVNQSGHSLVNLVGLFLRALQ